MTRSGSETLANAEDELVLELATALGRSVPVAERGAWLAMSVSQRERALERISVLERWREGNLTTDHAAELLHVKPKRFLELAAGWQSEKSLTELGAFAAMGRRASRLDGRAINILQKLLPSLTKEHRRIPIEQLRIRLLDAARLEIDRTGPHEKPVTLPSKMVVRRMIERERKRLDEESLIGTELHLDYSAVSLFDRDGHPFVVFALLDRASGLVLGHAVGKADEPLAGYSAAGADARGSLDAKAKMGRWGDRIERVQIVPDPGATVATGLERLGIVAAPANVQFTKPGANGRYIRKAIGDWLGRAQLRGSLTNGTSSVPTSPQVGPHTREAAAVEIARAVAAHNQALGLRRNRVGRAPQNMVALLDALVLAHQPVT